MKINTATVKHLIASQFPKWAQLDITPVDQNGWSNRTFHLGDNKLVRMPSAEEYASAVISEQTWLPRLAPHLPLAIPEPLAMGEPDPSFPWHWSIYRWLEGHTAADQCLENLDQFAIDLANFINALQSIDTTDGPRGTMRGGPLTMWQTQTDTALEQLLGNGQLDQAQVQAAAEIWANACNAPFDTDAVWYHGDVAAGNLLVVDGKLSAVIDFGSTAVGDPACDMAIAWTYLDKSSRALFRQTLTVSDAIWNRGKGWALWKALIVVARLIQTNAVEVTCAPYAIEQLLDDHSTHH